MSAELIPYPSDAAFRLLADAIPQIVWVARSDGSVEYFSRQWYDYTGLGVETLDEGWGVVLHPDDLARTAERWKNATNVAGEGYELDYRLRRGSDGAYRWFLGRARPQRDDDGQIIRWLGTCTDIHDQKMAEETLRQAKEQSDHNSKAKDEFLSVLSHELRTPLSAILGWVQLLEMGVLDPAESIDAVRTIKQQAKVQSQLIEDLLEMSRIINGKFHIRQETVPLTAVFDRVIETVRPSATDKHVTIEKKMWDESLQIQGDPQRIQQLAWNLLTNAVKFTPAGGRITVETKAKGDIAEINVCDTGKGIDSEQLARIFEHFSCGDSTATRAEGGLGLGLSIVRHIIRMHRGTIVAKSRGIDCGSEFIVTLPRVLAAPSSEPQIDRPPVGGESLRDVRVLVVDDEESARSVAEASLRAYGASVETVAVTSEALRILQSGRGFDVLVSDIGMPGMSGLDLIREIRNGTLPLSRLPAIALTAFASLDDESRSLDAGFSAHVPKPLEAELLVRQILRVTAR